MFIQPKTSRPISSLSDQRKNKLHHQYTSNPPHEFSRPPSTFLTGTEFSNRRRSSSLPPLRRDDQISGSRKPITKPRLTVHNSASKDGIDLSENNSSDEITNVRLNMKASEMLKKSTSIGKVSSGKASTEQIFNEDRHLSVTETYMNCNEDVGATYTAHDKSACSPETIKKYSDFIFSRKLLRTDKITQRNDRRRLFSYAEFTDKSSCEMDSCSMHTKQPLSTTVRTEKGHWKWNQYIIHNKDPGKQIKILIAKEMKKMKMTYSRWTRQFQV